MKKKIVIIDGDSFIHRAYHGYKTHNKKFSNENNYAVKGFTSMLSKTLNATTFDYLAIVLDHQGKSFRHELSPTYKANRAEKEDSFLHQIKIIHDFVKASGLPYFCKEGVEGDDVIGYLAKKAQEKGWLVDIYTGDKDIAQVLDVGTKLIDTRFNKEISLENIKDVFGVNKPYQIIDFLALQGDKADNIEGLAGCGVKTANKIIEEYDIIENFLEATDQDIIEKISKTVRSKEKTKGIITQIRENPSKLMLAKELTTLRTNFDLNLTLADLKIHQSRFDFIKTKEIVKNYQLTPAYSFDKKSLEWYNQYS